MTNLEQIYGRGIIQMEMETDKKRVKIGKLFGKKQSGKDVILLDNKDRIDYGNKLNYNEEVNVK